MLIFTGIMLQTSQDNHFLSVALKGKGLNTHGNRSPGHPVLQGSDAGCRTISNTGVLCLPASDDLHFGLGQARMVDSVLVRWPDLSEQMIKDVPADKVITLEMKNAGKPERRDI